MPDASLFDSVVHRLRLARVHRERLFAANVLARGCGGENDLLVQVVGDEDEDHIDVWVFNRRLPANGPSVVAVAGCVVARTLFVDIDHQGAARHSGRRPVPHRNLRQRWGIRLAHQAGADLGEPEFLHLLFSS
jgi:hypothetical protein